MGSLNRYNLVCLPLAIPYNAGEKRLRRYQLRCLYSKNRLNSRVMPWFSGKEIFTVSSYLLKPHSELATGISPYTESYRVRTLRSIINFLRPS